MRQHQFRVDYLTTRLRALVDTWWPRDKPFRRHAMLEIRRVIEDAYAEALREDWRQEERRRAVARAKEARIALTLREAKVLRENRERLLRKKASIERQTKKWRDINERRL